MKYHSGNMRVFKVNVLGLNIIIAFLNLSSLLTYHCKAKLLRNKFLLTITLVLKILLDARQFKNMTEKWLPVQL